MNLRTLSAFFIFLSFSFQARSQDCTLGIGTGDAATIIQIFQLNKTQIEKLGDWRAALAIEMENVEAEITLLFKMEPQSTKEELIKLAAKHDALERKILDISKMYDKKLIDILNKRQYERYSALCYEALREPIPQSPKPEKDPE